MKGKAASVMGKGKGDSVMDMRRVKERVAIVRGGSKGMVLNVPNINQMFLLNILKTVPCLTILNTLFRMTAQSASIRIPSSKKMPFIFGMSKIL